MHNINKYGLSRDIREPIKREIRQRCGFGCVNCGIAVYQYEHVEPQFSEAKEHNPDCIVLLCGGCHDRVTRGLLSKETIKIKSLSPKCKEQGFSFGPFDLGSTKSPEIVVGTFKGKNVDSLIRINGEEILSVSPSTQLGNPFLINALLCDRDGKEILKIVDNEWRTSSNNWDVEVIGSKIIIRKKLGDIVLVLRSEPPHRVVIERLDMAYKGTRIRCKEYETIEVITPTGQIFKSPETYVQECKVGIEVTPTGLSVGVGVGVGVGGGSLYIGSATLSSTNPSFRYPSISKTTKKPGRNYNCSCGSGLKYKKCCGSTN